MKVSIESRWCGLVPYNVALGVQRTEARRIVGSHFVSVLGVEHPPVLTLGKSYSSLKNPLPLPTQLLNSGFECVETDRGGQLTLHMPGQLVVYPIVDLRFFGLGVRQWVELLLTVTEKLLLNLGLAVTKQTSQPGVYTAHGKLAYVGIRVQNGVARHGISLNVNNELQAFNEIVACGVQNQNHDRVQNWLSNDPSVGCKNLYYQWVDLFCLSLQDAVRRDERIS